MSRPIIPSQLSKRRRGYPVARHGSSALTAALLLLSLVVGCSGGSSDKACATEAAVTVCAAPQGRGYRLDVTGLQPGSDATFTFTGGDPTSPAFHAGADGSIHGVVGIVGITSAGTQVRAITVVGVARDSTPVSVAVTPASR